VRVSFRRSGKLSCADEYPKLIRFDGCSGNQSIPKRMPTKLFVGGIPYRLSDEELRQHFSQAGAVVSVFIPMDRETGRPRGFAFVEMADDAAAEAAISMFNGTEMGGRRIAVNKARPMEERAPRG